MNEQEQRWLELARKGDQQAFCRLVDAYQRPVMSLTYRMLGDLEEAEDAAQETFLRAWSRLHQYNPEHKFSTWVFSIANHHCIDRLRKRRVKVVGLDDTPLAYSIQDERARPEDSLLSQENAEEMQALVELLPPDYRTPLVLRYWQECSYQEIGEVMGLSLPAVKSRLFRARQKLAEEYERSQATVRGKYQTATSVYATEPTRVKPSLRQSIGTPLRAALAGG
ncbi:MAG: sigma-70 family RNA polymerase sigma factor [Caldilineaceae bacterium]|nr:sigma-70 family RNA polymerase sigma factor [Caldilineaceae bacterium]HRJ42198.1 sigma-70 family RNA polymerase sigma factor [Caldilineaceae bacterium]